MKFYIYMCLACLLGWVTACSDDSAGIPVGTLCVGVEEDATLLTKAEKPVGFESLRVDILSEEGDTVRHYADYLTDVKGQKLVLPVGIYTVAVRSNQTEEAGWEKPFYSGAQEVTVQAGEITSAKVVCRIANTKVMVEYASNLADKFSKYETTVSNTSGCLTYTRDEYRAGYFQPEKLTADLELVNMDGNTFQMRRVFPNIKPRFFYKIKYSLNDDGNDSSEAGADFGGISIDEKADTIYYGIFVKEEDLFGKGVPKLTLDGFTDNKIVYKKTENPEVPEHSLKIQAANGIKQILVKADSHQFADYPLFDLCNLTSVEKGFLESLHFPVEDGLEGKQEWTADLTEFAASLALVSETEKTEHSFTVSVLDTYHQEKEISFSYELRPDVQAYVNEPQKWTTFALLKGFCADENSYFKILTDKGTVKDIKEVLRDADGNLSALVIGLKPGVVYTYWIVSDEQPDMPCEPFQFSLDVPSVVPNLGFEDWVSLSGQSPTGNKNYTSPNRDANNVYWESGNLGAAAANKTLTQETTETALSGSKKAALLKSLNAEIIGFGAFAAGSVFSGYVDKVSTSGANLMYGRPYQGYPTYLRGYYKYIPGIVNEYGKFTPEDVIKSGDPDECVINIALTTRQHLVVSMKDQVIPYPYDDPSVFAHGTYASGKTEDLTGETPKEDIRNGYAPFKIRLDYRSFPKAGEKVYILIMAASSRYGEYFTGSTNSVMYIDEFSLDYEYDAEAFRQTALKERKPVDINE